MKVKVELKSKIGKKGNAVWVAVWVATLCILCGLAFWSYQIRAHTPAQGKPIVRTVMLYMIGSDLESGGELGTQDLAEIIDAGKGEYLNVVAQTGGANAVGWRTVKRLSVEENTLQVHQDLGRQNMASAKSLQEFVEWGIKNYPAERYSLIFWSHGSGAISGSDLDPGQIGPDEIFNDSLSIAEIRQALDTVQNQQFAASSKSGSASQSVKPPPLFELIGFDACLMGSLEVAAQLASYSRYFLASQEIEPGQGLNYQAWVSKLIEQPQLETVALGKVMIDSYFEFYHSDNLLDGNTQTALTMSLLDLQKTQALQDALALWSDEINAVLLSNPSLAWALSDARAQSENYARGGRFDMGMIDLIDFVKKVEIQLTAANSPLDDAVKSKIKEVGQNLSLLAKTAFVSLSQTSKSRPHANGISVFVPSITYVFHGYSEKVMQKNLFSQSFLPDWLEWQKRYVEALKSHPLNFEVKNAHIENKMLKADLQGNYTEIDYFDVAVMLNAVGEKRLVINNWGLPEARENDQQEGINGNTIQAWLPTFLLTFEGQPIAQYPTGTKDDADLYQAHAKVNGQPAFITIRRDVMGNSIYLDSYSAVGYEVTDSIWDKVLAVKKFEAGDKVELHYLNMRVPFGHPDAYSAHYPVITLARDTPLMRFKPIPKGTYEMRFLAVDDEYSFESINGARLEIP